MYCGICSRTESFHVRRLSAITSVIVMLAAAIAAAGSPARALAVQVVTQPPLAPAFDPAVTDYVTRCTSSVPVRVTVMAPAGTTVDVDRQGPGSGNFTTAVGLNPGQRFAVVTSDGESSSTYQIRCLPSDFPDWTFQRSGTPQAEWYLVSPFASPNYAIVFDANGAPVWWFKTAANTLDFKLFPDGNFAWAHVDATAEERRTDGSLAHTIGVPSGAVLDPHELLQLANRDYLMSVDRVLPGQTVCGQSNLTIADNGFEEVARDGSLVRSWWASDHIPLSEVPNAWCHQIISQPPGSVYDPYHINAVEPDGDGYLVSLRRLDAVYRINQADGSVAWKLGGVPRSRSLTVVGDPLGLAGDLFRGQHDVRALGDGSVTVHDNGFHPGSVRPPRAVRYAIDTTAMTATLLEQIKDPGTVETPYRTGSARKLPGGDWVVNWGSAGLATELTSLGSRVMSLTFGRDSLGKQLFSYRAQPLLPGVLDRQALRDGMDRQFPRGYPRPKGADVIRASLVPAFDKCIAPDRNHGGPLAFGSCSSPSTASLLTVGTSDANGAATKSTGYVIYKAVLGNPSTPANEADVTVQVSLTDVRRKRDLSDYTGQLQVRGAVRITDRLNGPATDEAATVQDSELPVILPCTATADPSIGGACGVTTSLNAVVAGSAVESKRSIWELGPVQVFDGGTSETAGAADARLFERQGLFIP
jgi:hypothetical protein